MKYREYSKEKRAGNIPILIIQTLLFIQRKQYGLADRRLETLNKYRVRYLEQDTNIRSKLFIKMLLQIPKGHFDQSKVSEKTTDLLEQLTNTSKADSKQLVYTEIIPYEHLWGMVWKVSAAPDLTRSFKHSTLSGISRVLFFC